jgi:glutathione S-transferase
MIFPTLVTLLILIFYQLLSFNVTKARGKYGVKAPAVTGNLDFERRYRVQMNTLEQMVVFLPAMWIFGKAFAGPLISDFWTGERIAALIGAIWLVGRILYARGYYADAEKRYLGMGINLLCNSVLLLGGLITIVKKIFILHPIQF